MYELLVLAALLIGVIVLSKTREGLEPTQKIKSAGFTETPDSKELEYRWSLMNDNVKSELLKAVNTANFTFPKLPAQGTPEQKAKIFGSHLIETFYTLVYTSATQPITETNIDQYVANLRSSLNGPDPTITPVARGVLKGFLDSGALKQLLMAYYVLPPPPPPPPTPVPEYVYPELPKDLPPQLNNVLDIYRTNYLEYRTTGQAGYKTAYEAAETYINNYMKTLQDKLSEDANYIKDFLDKYGTTNTDLANLQARMKIIRQEGPKMEDAYLTVKKGDVEEPVDYTEYYIRGAVLAAIVGVVVAVSFF
jgi:hypothetical protein